MVCSQSTRAGGGVLTPLCVNLTMESISRVNMECRKTMGGGVVRGGFDSHGRPFRADC